MASSIRQRIESWRIGAKLGRLLRVLGIVTAILLLLIVFLLGTDPGRHTLLKTFLPVALDKIPGHLTLDEASWPSLGRLEFAGVLWRNVASDTLLAATDCGLELSLGDLRHKDLYVKRIWAAELLADLPALQAQFTDTTASVEPQPAKSDTTQGGGVPFLRTGALTGIPSVGLDRLAIVDATIQLTENESIRLQELIASADLRQGRSPQLSARIRMRPRPALAFSTRLEANLSDSLRVGFAPLHLALADSGTIPDPASAPLTGFVTLSREELLTGKGQPAGTVSGLRVTGDFGQLILDGDLVRGGGGSFRLQAKRPPSRIKFMQALASIVGEESRSVSLADSLWTLWPATDGPDVDVHCEMTPAAGDQPFRPGRVAVSANFILPGPRDLKPFLPPESRVNDWDYIRGWLKAEAQLDHEPIDFQATLDLSETSWLDTALISLHGEPHHIMVDSLALALPGVALNVSGTWDPEQMDLRARVDIPDSSLLTRWQSEVTKDLDVRLALDAHARGPLTTPDLMAQFELSGHYQGLSIPSLLGRLQTDTREVNLTLEASEGLNYSDFELTSLWTQYSGNLPDSLGQFVGRFQVTASSSEHSLATEGSIEMGEVILLQVDSLATTWRSQRMVARQPFSLKQDSKDQLWQIVGLDIAGDPGHIWGEGTVRPDSIDVHLSLDLAVVVASLQEFATRPLPALAKDDTLLLAGNLRVKGTNVNPAGFLTLKTGIHGHEQLSRIMLETTTWLLPHLEDTTPKGFISEIFANSPPLPENTPWPGLAATVQITHLDTLLLAGQGRFPTHISFHPFAWKPSLSDSVVFTVRSRTIHLAELHPYLPPGLTLKGDCRLAADLRGVNNSYQISGEFDAPSMEARLEDGSWLRAGNKIQLGGTIQQPFSLKQGSTDQHWQIVGFDIAGDPSHIGGAGTVRLDSIDVDLSLDLAVVVASLQRFTTTALPALARDDTLLLAGNLRVKGPSANPAGFLTLKTGIHGHEQLSRIVLETTAWLLPPGEVTITSGPISDIFANSPPLPANTPWPGLATTVRITHQDTLLMTGQGRFPTHISLYPFAWEPSLTDSVAFAVRSRTIHLAELHPYLPPGLSLKGECRFAADIRGVDNDFQVSGEFDAPTMETRLEDGSWLSAGGKIELEGTIQEPKVAGHITVNGGLFRLPEVPPHLLPTEGEALLWQAAAADSLSETALENLAVKQDRAEADSTLVKTDEPIPRQKIKPSLAVQVIIPGNLWIRGHGLDVQLTGNMDVGMRAGLPAAAGELKAVHGTFRLLGRVFEIERGKVTLYGDEVALNPELDLSLITYVSGTLIRVQLLGTALEPELILTSEPYLSEADIISMLLFGQQMYQLDSGQEDLLRSRTNEILASYGASQLQDQVGSQMGIDIITYGQGTDKDSTAGSLTIGKYLSPKVLMKYERVLDKRSAYYVHLNYTINRNFRIETTYSEGNNSGVSFKWAKDY